MSYGVIFWGNSPHSTISFKMQKLAIRTMMECGYRESCRGLFVELKILPLASQYIFSLLMFVVNVGITLPQTVQFVIATPDIEMTCICPRQH